MRKSADVSESVAIQYALNSRTNGSRRLAGMGVGH
ncbi:hypothetical protein AVEN_58260-1, partial [Araneus ventricosus]